MQAARVFGVLALICLCTAAVFLLDVPTYIKVRNGQVTELSAVSLFDLKKGTVVTGDAGVSLGFCAEEYTTSFGVHTSKDSSKRYYVLMPNKDVFMLYCTVSKEEYTLLDKMAAETVAYYHSAETYQLSEDYEDLAFPTTKMNIQGDVTRIPSEIEGYFREWYAKNIGDDFDAQCVPLMISHMNFNRLGAMLLAGIAAAVGAVCFGLLAVAMRAKTKRSMPDCT